MHQKKFATTAAALMGASLVYAASAVSVPAQVGSQGSQSNRLAEKIVETLPPEPLFWRLETFVSRDEAEAAESPWSLLGEPSLLDVAAGQIWLATLGPVGGSSSGGILVAEIGPLPHLEAADYRLTFGEQTVQPGGFIDTHTHPGPEVFFVLAGQLSLQTASGVALVPAGESVIAPGDTPIRPSNEGAEVIQMFALFLRDAARPLTSPAEFPAGAP